VYKEAPFIPAYKDNAEFTPQESLVEVDMVNLKNWGLNHVRLGVMWEAVETSEGVYNTTYLDEVEQLINKLGEHGIWTMVDMHQDVLSRTNCGEGIPAFYATMASAGAVC